MTDHGAGQRAATERPSGIATVVVAVLAIGSVAAAAIRAMPNMGSPDRGVFVSTAERMVAGDRLYVDVWDNKDPVFYYLMAAGRLVSPLMDYVLEVGWLAVVAVATYALARRASGATLPAVLAAATGLVAVTGAAYIAGYTYLPGTALVLVVAALTADRRDVWVGVAFGVLLFTKPMMAPLALVALAPWWWRTRSVRSVGRMAAGLAPVAVAFVVLLAARGELGGWVAAQLDNVGYSQQRLRDNGQNPVIDHLSRVIGAHEVVMLALLTVVGVAIAWWSRRRADAASRDAATLAVAMLATAVMSVLVIAATGLGPWHNQLIQPAAVQAAALLAVPAAWLLQRPVTAVACLLLAPIAGWALAGPRRCPTTATRRGSTGGASASCSRSRRTPSRSSISGRPAPTPGWAGSTTTVTRTGSADGGLPAPGSTSTSSSPPARSSPSWPASRQHRWSSCPRPSPPGPPTCRRPTGTRSSSRARSCWRPTTTASRTRGSACAPGRPAERLVRSSGGSRPVGR